VVYFGEWNGGAGGAEHADVTVGHEDIGVGGWSAAVENDVGDGSVEDEQRAFVGIHGDVGAGECGDALRPDAGGIDDDVSVDGDVAAGAFVVQAYCGDFVVLQLEVGYGVLRKDLRAMCLCIEEIGSGK